MVEYACHTLSPVIPGRRVSAGPGIQMQAQSFVLDSGFTLSARPGMTFSAEGADKWLR
jgi:hypothetical protein